jgi:hypothetical protein
MEIEGEVKIHVFVAVSRDEIPFEQPDQASRLKTDLLGQFPLDARLDLFALPVHVPGGDLHDDPARRLTVLADEDKPAFRIHWDDGDTWPVVDPALLESPAVGEPYVALIDIEDAAVIDEFAVELSCGHDGFLQQLPRVNWSS